MSTSPVISHPSTALIEEVAASLSFMPALCQCPKLVVCDGYKVKDKNKFRSGQITRERAQAYIEYKRRLRSLAEDGCEGGSAGGAGGRETGDDGEAEGGGGESGGDEGARMRTCVTMGLVAPSTVTPTAALSANRLLASPCIVLRTLLAADASVNVTVAFTLTLAALTSRLMSAGGTPR